MPIHSNACVSPTAVLGDQVDVGPFAVIEGDVEIGAGCRIASHAVIRSGTRLGQDNIVEVGAVLGGRPQHLGAGAQVGELWIGEKNHFREYTTVHLGLSPGHPTTIGNQNLVMVSAHVGHDCRIGDRNIIANNVMLAGHVTVEDQVYLSGAAGVHQFCRVGRLAMVGGQARVTQDVPPFVMVDGKSTSMVGLNSIGLRRAGIGAGQTQILKQAYRIAFRSTAPWEDRLGQLGEFSDPLVAHLLTFLKQTERGCIADRRNIERLEGRTTAERGREWNEKGEIGPLNVIQSDGTVRKLEPPRAA